MLYQLFLQHSRYDFQMDQLVSVIIPNHNGEKFVYDAVASALSQDYSNIEVIVVDDGSTDDSKEILRAFQNRIQLITTANYGAATARNIGISNARGKFIAFLDSDDLWEQDKITLQMEMMLAGDYDLIYCSGRDFDLNGLNGEISKAQYSGNCYDYFKQFPSRAIIIQGCSSALIRASLLQSSGVFDEKFSGAAEDWDFFRRFCRYAHVGFLPNVLVHYRRHEKSITARPPLDWYMGNSMAIIKMFCDDSDIDRYARRVIWIKFQFLAFKTFAKKREFGLASRAFSKAFLPVSMVP
jgi:glycosyltransferase involved in cell wall biosynthesis